MAAFNGAPFNEIMQATSWKSQTTFTSFYLKAMASQADGLFALHPNVAGQTVIQPPGTSSDEKEGHHPSVPLIPSGDWICRLLPTLYEARSLFSVVYSHSHSVLA